MLLFLSPVCAADLGEVRVVVPALPAQFDPHKAASLVERTVASELFTGLVSRDAMGALVPGAATWQISSDGLTYTFTLHGNLVWSDGKPVQAGDFAAGIMRARSPATAAPFATDLAGIAAVDAPDAKTVKIVLTQVSPDILDVLSHPVAAPVPRHRMDALGDAWAQPQNIVTNGPARMSGAALLTPTAKITFRTAASAEEAAAFVRDGAADLTLGFGFENPGGTPARLFRADLGQNLYFVAVNTTHPPLSIREVRHALAMSIDRDGLLKSLRIDTAYAATAMVPPAVYGATAHNTSAYAAMQAEMRAAIADVLLGERKIDAAHPVTLTLIHPKGALHAAVAKSLTAAWAPLGVRTRVLEQSTADYLQSLRDGTFDLALAVLESTDSQPSGYLTPFLNADPRNLARYNDQDFRAKMLTVDTAMDPAHRLILQADAEATLLEDQPILPIFFFTPLLPVAEGLKGWTANGAGYHPLHTLSR